MSVEGGPEQLTSRQLSRAETAAWYGIAAVTYVAAAIFEKGLLNWLIGPAWLIAIVCVGPAAFDRVRRRPRR